MKDQIEFNFRRDTQPCRPRRTRRAEWARLWFTRMHEVVDEAEDFIGKDDRSQNSSPVLPHHPLQGN